MDNHQDLVNGAVVDVVAVTVKVPDHLELATAALDAGKAVCCEWPLGNGLAEAQILAALARKKGVVQRLSQRQGERCGDAVDRARARGGRGVLLPR